MSLEYASKLMKRRYTDAQTIRKILQTLWYQVNNGQGIYVGVGPAAIGCRATEPRRP